MPYDKYKKIKARKTGQSVIDIDNYCDNDEKTKIPDMQQQPDQSLQPSPIQDIDEYADDKKKTNYHLADQIDELESEMNQINPLEYQHLVSVINCQNNESFVTECTAAEQLYHSHKTEGLNAGHKANEAFHIISSCKGNDMDPLLVHQAGIELARELAGDEFAVKVCTHLNTGNYHNHIIINAYSIDGTHKFKDEYHLYKKIRRISNEIGLQYGFEIIAPGNYPDKKNTWSNEAGNTEEANTFASQIKQDIRSCIKGASSFQEYEARMLDLGYTMDHSKLKITYRKDGMEASDYRLGSRYSQEGIEERIRKNSEFQKQKKISSAIAKETKRENHANSPQPFEKIRIPKFDKKGRRIPALVRFLLYIRRCIRIVGNAFFDPAAAATFPENDRLSSAEKKTERINIAISLCLKYQIETLDGLKELIKQTGMEAKTADYQAGRLLGIADHMTEAIDTLKNRDDLKKYITNLGLDDSYFTPESISETDIKKNLAALDPPTGKQKKQLWNALDNSGYRLKDGGFSAIDRTECQSVLEFLNGKTDQKPSCLYSMEEYQKEKAAQYIGAKANEKAKMLAEKYGKERASPAQMKLIRRYIPVEYQNQAFEGLTKDQAIRILNRYKPPEIHTVKAAGPAPSSTFRPSKWMAATLADLKLLHPEEMKEINMDSLDKETANNLVNYYLAQHDSVLDEIVKKPEQALKESQEQTVRKPIDMKLYSEEERACILEYKKLQDILASYGLDSEDEINHFIQKYDDILAQSAAELSTHKEKNASYRELNQLQSIINHSASISFAFGARYSHQNDNQIKEEFQSINQDEISRLRELETKISRTIHDLSGWDISTQIDADDLSLIKELQQFFPEYFAIQPPSPHMTTSDAYEILSQIQSDQVIKKTLKKLEAQEQNEEWKRDRQKGNQL